MVHGRFQALFFGDSIVWGQGLREEDKFSTWVVQWLNEYHPNLRAYKTVKAHSGAIIGTGGDVAPKMSIREDPGWPGEVPSTYPTIQHQIAAYADSDPNDADLIVIDGGINDVNIRTIFNPRTTQADLKSHIRYACGTLMPTLLMAAAAKFPNPRTKIFVLGYYPIVSAQSRPTGVIPMMTAFGVPVIGPAGWNPWRSIVDNALLFESYSDELIQGAILSASAARPGRFVWVKPGIKAENSAFGPQAWVFGLQLPQGAAEDDVAADRRAQCMIQTDLEQRALCFRASAGHPNRWGARAYFNAIYPVLQREYGL